MKELSKQVDWLLERLQFQRVQGIEYLPDKINDKINATVSDDQQVDTKY